MLGGGWGGGRHVPVAPGARRARPRALVAPRRRGAVVNRERAYAGFRRDGELARAARIALWLSASTRSCGGTTRRERLAGAAERLLADVAPGSEGAGSRSRVPSGRAIRRSRAAGGCGARRGARTATPTSSCARCAARPRGVALGRLDEGLAHIDEAMAAAIGGEPATLETFADVSCTLMLACELAGDSERPQQWSQVLEAFVRKYDHVRCSRSAAPAAPTSSWRTGRIDAAEQELSPRFESSRRQASARAASIRRHASRRSASCRGASTRRSDSSRASRTSRRRSTPLFRYGSPAASPKRQRP